MEETVFCRLTYGGGRFWRRNLELSCPPRACIVCSSAPKSLRKQYKEVGLFRFPNKSKFNTFSEYTKVRRHTKINTKTVPPLRGTTGAISGEVPRHALGVEGHPSPDCVRCRRPPPHASHVHASLTRGSTCAVMYSFWKPELPCSCMARGNRRPTWCSLRVSSPAADRCVRWSLYLQERRRTGFDGFLRLVVSRPPRPSRSVFIRSSSNSSSNLT